MGTSWLKFVDNGPKKWLINSCFQEELPPVNQLASVSNKAIDRISEQSPDLKLYRPKTRGRVPKANDVKPLDSILDRSLEDNFNKSLAEIESIELLNDSISLLKIEQKNKKAGAVSKFKT